MSAEGKMELLPCPFCERPVQLRLALWPSEGDRDAIIHAAPMHAGFCGFSDFSIDTVDDGKSVTAAWNRRPSQTAVREALENARNAIVELEAFSNTPDVQRDPVWMRVRANGAMALRQIAAAHSSPVTMENHDA